MYPLYVKSHIIYIIYKSITLYDMYSDQQDAPGKYLAEVIHFTVPVE